MVLKKKLNLQQVEEIVDEKKTSVFKHLLKRPKKSDIHVHSITLYYEAILLISGSYKADYYRKAIHTIKVDSNVKEVVLGDGVFPARPKSGLGKILSNKGKNLVDLELEEHVFIEDEKTIYFDHHGNEIKFPFKLNSKILENYPKRILEQNKSNIKKPEITYDQAKDNLAVKLKRPLEPDVRDLNDEYLINEISEIYVPIYEARLVDPKKKVAILRIDAVRNKIL